jgi:hypothetical protein
MLFEFNEEAAGRAFSHSKGGTRVASTESKRAIILAIVSAF